MVMPMNTYANPKNDVAFKKLFGSRKHDSILIDFLNDVLGREVAHTIESVSITDPYNLPLAAGLKASIVDVRCFDDHNRHYQIEMQVAPQLDYAERCQFYTSYFITKQLEMSARYKKLDPIIFISIVDFNMFDHDHFLSHHKVMDTYDNKQYLKLFEFHFLELPKFTKNENELTTDIDRWAYFFKNAGNCRKVPASLAHDKILNEAFEVLKRAAWTPEDLDEYIRYLDAQMSSQSIFETALINDRMEIAKKMLQEGININTILKLTGLSEEYIEKLKKS